MHFHTHSLRLVRNSIPLSTAIIIASSFILPHFDYCNSILLNLLASLPVPVTHPHTPKTYSLPSLSNPSILFIQKLLSTCKTSSYLDPIPHWLTSKYAHNLAPSYKQVIDLSLSAGHVPQYIKLAHITPILKRRNLDKSVLSNYRPISNLSFLSKTLECVVAKQLNTYLTNNKILDKFQSAYTSCKSTETAIIQTLILPTYPPPHTTVP